MRTIIRKAYYNYEKEEKWLNEMSAKGMALIDYSWCRYVFDKCDPGEYVYRIELLNKTPSHPESKNYLNFMEDNGVEHIASYMRWVYFRRKALDGEFDIYSDLDSKIKHFQRINLLWILLAFSEFIIGLSNIVIGITNITKGTAIEISPLNLTGGVLCTCLGFALLAVGHPVRKNLKKLKIEKNIRE